MSPGARRAALIVSGALLLSTTLAATVPAGFTRCAGRDRRRADRARVHARRPPAHHARRAAACASIQNGALVATPAITFAAAQHLHELRARAAGRRRRSAFATNGFIYLFHTFNDSVAATCVNRVSRFTMSGNTRRSPPPRAGPRRQHALDRRQPQRGRPAVRQGRLSLHQRSATAAATTRRQRLRAARTTPRATSTC